jgi:hypothetical protein
LPTEVSRRLQFPPAGVQQFRPRAAILCKDRSKASSITNPTRSALVGLIVLKVFQMNRIPFYLCLCLIFFDNYFENFSILILKFFSQVFQKTLYKTYRIITLITNLCRGPSPGIFPPNLFIGDKLLQIIE